MTANMRTIYVSAFLEAWDKVCTHDNCIEGARITGIVPTNAEAVKRNKWVDDLTREEQETHNRIQARKRKRLDIGSSKITCPEKYAEIVETVKRSKEDQPLCNSLCTFVSPTHFFWYYLLECKKRNVHILSTPRPYGDFTFDALIKYQVQT